MVVLLVGMIALIKFGLGYLRDEPFQVIDGRLMAGFSVLLSLQVAFGIVFLLWNGISGTGFPAYRIMHGLPMLFALLVTRLSSRWKDAEDKTRLLNNLLVVFTALMLIFVGTAFLPGALIR